MKHLSISNSKEIIKFILKCMMFSIPMIVGIVIFYFVFYRNFETYRDIGRLGMIPFPSDYMKNDCCFEENRVTNYSRNDLPVATTNTLWTIGDSFSQLGICGYQNYLAHQIDSLNIINIPLSSGYDPEDELLMLLSSDSIVLPKVIVVESVERFFITRLNKAFKMKQIMGDGPDTKKDKKSFLEWTREFYKKQLNIQNNIKHFTLSEPLFSCKGYEDDLYVLSEDMDNPSRADVESAQVALDSILNIAMDKGVYVVYLIAMDKYDAYQDYIVDAHTKKDVLNDAFFSNHPQIINSKDILLPMIKNGEKDVYYCDDTHWSPISAMVLSFEIERRLKNINKQ